MATTTNLLDETLGVLAENCKTTSDVRYVIHVRPVHEYYNKLLVKAPECKRYCTWTDFIEYARNFNYDNSYGLTEVPTGLKIVGDDWYLHRVQVYGSEWWEFQRSTQKRPSEYAPIFRFA